MTADLFLEATTGQPPDPIEEWVPRKATTAPPRPAAAPASPRARLIAERLAATGIDLLGDDPLPIDPKDQAQEDAWREAHPFKGHDYQLARRK